MGSWRLLHFLVRAIPRPTMLPTATAAAPPTTARPINPSSHAHTHTRTNCTPRRQWVGSFSTVHQHVTARRHTDKNNIIMTMVYWIKFWRPSRQNKVHFGDILLSQSLGLVLKKNYTQWRNTSQTRKQNTISQANTEKHKTQTRLNKQKNPKSIVNLTKHCCLFNCVTWSSSSLTRSRLGP